MDNYVQYIVDNNNQHLIVDNDDGRLIVNAEHDEPAHCPHCKHEWNLRIRFEGVTAHIVYPGELESFHCDLCSHTLKVWTKKRHYVRINAGDGYQGHYYLTPPTERSGWLIDHFAGAMPASIAVNRTATGFEIVNMEAEAWQKQVDRANFVKSHSTGLVNLTFG